MSEIKTTFTILIVIFFLAGVFLFFQGIFTSDSAYTLGGLIATIPGIIAIIVSKAQKGKTPAVTYTPKISPSPVVKKEQVVSQPVAANLCPNCKAPTDPEMFFCDKCGTKLK